MGGENLAVHFPGVQEIHGVQFVTGRSYHWKCTCIGNNYGLSIRRLRKYGGVAADAGGDGGRLQRVDNGWR